MRTDCEASEYTRGPFLCTGKQVKAATYYGDQTKKCYVLYEIKGSLCERKFNHKSHDSSACSCKYQIV